QKAVGLEDRTFGRGARRAFPSDVGTRLSSFCVASRYGSRGHSMKWAEAAASVFLCVLLAGCPGGGDGGTPASSSPASVLPVSVGTSNLCRNVNELCGSVTICQPGTSNCQTISDLLVDVGSVGLRVFGSLLTIPLQQEVDGQGNPLGTCAAFADGG